MNNNIVRSINVPDALIHPPKLFELHEKEIRAYGRKRLTNHQVISIKQNEDFANTIVVSSKGIIRKIECEGIINAAGPWSGKIAKLIKQNVELQLTRGCGIYFAGQLVSQAINRCRFPIITTLCVLQNKKALGGQHRKWFITQILQKLVHVKFNNCYQKLQNSSQR